MATQLEPFIRTLTPAQQAQAQSEQSQSEQAQHLANILEHIGKHIYLIFLLKTYLV